MALIEGGVVTQLHNLVNEIEVVYGSTSHREYIPKTRGIRIKRKGQIVYLLLDSDVHAAEGAPVIKMDYKKITDPHCGSPSQLITILLHWIGTSTGVDSKFEEIDGTSYVGKLPGRNGDFDVSYHDAHIIHIDTHPNVGHNLEEDDIEYIRQIDVDGEVVAVFDRDTTPMNIVGDFLTIPSANFSPNNQFVVVTNLLKHVYVPDLEFMDSLIGKPAGQNGDFTVHYHNFHMIHFLGLPVGTVTKVYSEDIVQIVVLDEDDHVYMNITHDEFDIHTTANGVQVDGNDFTDIAFHPTDRFIIYTNIPRGAVANYTAPVVLVVNSLIGIYDDIWRDQGVEIDCRGYNNLSLWIVFQPNESVNNELKILSKHTTAGADEYRLDSYASYIKVLGDNNIKVKFDFVLDNSTPFVQVLTRMIGVTGTSSTSTSTTSTTTSTTSTTISHVIGRIWIQYTLGY